MTGTSLHSGRKVVNRLERTVTRALEDYCLLHHERFAQEAKTCEQIAAEASAALSARIVESNVRAAFAIMKLALPKAQVKRVKATREDVAGLQRQTDLCLRRLDFLAKNLGVTWPSDLQV